MKNVKKMFYRIIAITTLSIAVVKNFVYADVIIDPYERIIYSPFYYIAIIALIAIVMGISILILRKIYKDNQLKKNTDKEDEEGIEKKI